MLAAIAANVGNAAAARLPLASIAVSTAAEPGSRPSSTMSAVGTAGTGVAVANATLASNGVIDSATDGCAPLSPTGIINVLVPGSSTVPSMPGAGTSFDGAGISVNGP